MTTFTHDELLTLVKQAETEAQTHGDKTVRLKNWSRVSDFVAFGSALGLAATVAPVLAPVVVVATPVLLAALVVASASRFVFGKLHAKAEEQSKQLNNFYFASKVSLGQLAPSTAEGPFPVKQLESLPDGNVWVDYDLKKGAAYFGNTPVARHVAAVGTSAKDQAMVGMLSSASIHNPARQTPRATQQRNGL